MRAGILAAAFGLAAFAGCLGSAQATTLNGTTDANDLGSFGIGSTFMADSTGLGIADGTFTTPADGRTYFDYVYTFTLTDQANLDSDIFANAGNTFAEFHAVVSTSNPTGSFLYRNPDPDNPDLATQDPGMYKHYDNATPPNEIANTNLIDIPVSADFTSAGSSNGSGVGVHLASLDAGIYYLRLFGVSDPGSVGDFSGLFSVSKVVAVAATPIPAALPLFASALGMLGFAARKRRKAALAA